MDTFHTRAEVRSANVRAQWLAAENALGRRTDLANTLDAGVRFLRSMKDQGASKDALHDMAASIHDQVQNIEAGINRELDDQGGAPEGAVDMADLQGFLKELGA